MRDIAGRHAARFSIRDDELQVIRDQRDSYWRIAIYGSSDRTGWIREYATNPDLDERFRLEVYALRPFIVNFNDLAVTRQLVIAVAREIVERGETAWMDTDYGWVIHVRELLQSCERNLRWDWRGSAPG